MFTRHRAGRKVSVLAVLFIFMSVILLSGVLLCLTKTSNAKADYYLAAANNYIEQSKEDLIAPESETYLIKQSYNMLVKAAQETPYSPEVWTRMAVVLKHLGEYQKAKQANDIATLLGQKEQTGHFSNFLSSRPVLLTHNENTSSEVR